MSLVYRAYRITLDPTPAQESTLAQHAGAARWAFNHALAVKVEAHKRWKAEVSALVEAGIPEDEARKNVKIPMKPAIQKALNTVKGDDRQGIDGACPWWHTVSTYAFQSAFVDADQAWKNWQDSLAGRRKGRRVGYPRFKKKGRSRDSFRLHHDVKRPTIRVVTSRRLLLPRIGEVRTHDNLRRLNRALSRRAGQIQSVTVSRGAHRWYASVLVSEDMTLPAASRRQRTAGTVGVDLGVKVLAALSTGDLVANPRVKASNARRMVKASRAYARTVKGSRRRGRARRRLGRLHHQEALRRATVLHGLTKRLASGWAVVAVEDLNVAGMTRSASGTVERPGRNVAQKTGLNRSVLDASFGEIRRQLTYKTVWYGSRLAVLDRWFPSSKTCSGCGVAKAKLALSERTFTCSACGLVMDRDHNAAVNIARFAVASDDVGDVKRPWSGSAADLFQGSAALFTLKRFARTAHASSVATQEDPSSDGPPQRSNALASPAP